MSVISLAFVSIFFVVKDIMLYREILEKNAERSRLCMGDENSAQLLLRKMEGLFDSLGLMDVDTVPEFIRSMNQ